MKALSLTQPWASLVAIGAKRYETRSWPTKYRGQLAIAAAKKFPLDCRALCTEDPFEEVLKAASLSLLDLRALCGHILCVVDANGCVPTLVHQDNPLDVQMPNLPASWPRPGEHEVDFGDYSAGRFAWPLDDVFRLPTPIEASGALGIWEVPESLAEKIYAQLPMGRRP
jgi:activating signal cointegrator 1